MDAGAEIIITGIDRDDRGGPQQQQADLGDDRHNLIARLAREQEADSDQLHRRLPLGELRHGHADAERGKILTQSRNQDFTDRITIAAHNDQPWMMPSAASINRQEATSSLSAIGSSMRPKADCWFQMRA